MEVKGKGGISAKIIADSISSVNGQRITTFELEYPRFIHSEFMTHRLFSRNAASSRAIPVEKVIDHVKDNMAKPIHWGRNRQGMQAKSEIVGSDLDTVKDDWQIAGRASASIAQRMMLFGVHKQIVNRILEPYQFIKVVCTATCFDNFFWLRCHEDAQPEIKELADCMYKAYSENTPEELSPEEWHTPYVGHMNDHEGNLQYYIDVNGETVTLTLEQALKVSSSCCAQVSYRKLDESFEKAKKIYNMLIASDRVHSSPFEHQATPISYDEECKFAKPFYEWDKGITHQDKEGDFWSGNFKGWIQHRQLIPNNTCWNFEEGVN